MFIVYFSKLSDFFNRNFYVKSSLQGRMKIVRLDEFDSGILVYGILKQWLNDFTGDFNRE